MLLEVSLLEVSLLEVSLLAADLGWRQSGRVSHRGPPSAGTGSAR
jgi:hypothetical protein